MNIQGLFGSIFGHTSNLKTSLQQKKKGSSLTVIPPIEKETLEIPVVISMIDEDLDTSILNESQICN